MKRVLVTGAAGRIARSFVAAYGDRYALRLAAHRPERLDGEAEPRDVVPLELGDLESCRAACRGMDVVLHLAARANPNIAFEELLEANIRGVYHIFRAAADAGCARVVFGSSGRAVRGYPPDVAVRPDMAVCPIDIYGAAKCWGEALAHYFSASEGLSCICVRIGAFWGKHRVGSRPGRNVMSRLITPRDCDQLLWRCIEAEGIRFAIVHGISNNREKTLDITSARELLGYEPLDDAWDLIR